MSKSVELSEYQKMTYFHRAASARLIILSWKSKFTSSSGVFNFLNRAFNTTSYFELLVYESLYYNHFIDFSCRHTLLINSL